MGFRVVDATNAWRMRRTRGEILRCFFRAAVACALLDFAEPVFAGPDFEDLVVADLVVLEVAGLLEVSVWTGAAVLWSVCRSRAREDAHNEPQARPVTRIRSEVRE
jgi:hypothetical protein